MPLAVSEAELRALLDETAFIRCYGFELESIAEGEATLLARFDPSFLRPGNVIAGPMFMAAADVAMWFAIMTRRGRHDKSVTLHLNTTFLNSAREEDFLCRARVLKLGRHIIYGVAECVTLDGRPLTHHGVTYILPRV
jgi:acyl-coenzyme A thioesterase PaaI-like protein